jgi:glycosyltransferase involved in cell wall biosynthesis
MGCAHQSNVEGFFDMVPHGLGFLSLDQQMWVGGSIGKALEADIRYRDFLTTNASRTRMFGELAETDKAAFLRGAACVVVPARGGAGAKVKTADAIASGRPVVATRGGLEGYGSIVRDVIGRGVYIVETPTQFRALVRQALRGEAVGCSPTVRQHVSLGHLSQNLNHAYQALFMHAPEQVSGSPPDSQDRDRRPKKEMYA